MKLHEIRELLHIAGAKEGYPSPRTGRNEQVSLPACRRELEGNGGGLMKYRGEKVRFEAQRTCRWAGRNFKTGQAVTVVLARNWDGEDGLGEGGPWGWGGYRSSLLRRLAGGWAGIDFSPDL